MKTYEYDVLQLFSGIEYAVSTLNQKGKEGWKIIDIVSKPGGGSSILLMKENAAVEARYPEHLLPDTP